jgi:hypothetical protein
MTESEPEDTPVASVQLWVRLLEVVHHILGVVNASVKIMKAQNFKSFYSMQWEVFKMTKGLLSYMSMSMVLSFLQIDIQQSKVED